jgi:dTDP-4-amino-4,6-dideoxygalactose transaminase
LGPRKELVEALKAEGLNAGAGYVDRATYLYDVFTKRSGLGETEYPFSLAPEIQYKPGLCPNTEKIVDTCVFMPVNEFFTEEDCDQTLAGLRKVARALARK